MPTRTRLPSVRLEANLHMLTRTVVSLSNNICEATAPAPPDRCVAHRVLRESFHS